MSYDQLSEAERERLRAAFDAGFSAGSCTPSRYPDHLYALIDAVQDDWFRSLEAVQAAERARYAFPGPEAIPEWLRAETERVAALGDTTPPEGWGSAGWPV